MTNQNVLYEKLSLRFLPLTAYRSASADFCTQLSWGLITAASHSVVKNSSLWNPECEKKLWILFQSSTFLED